MATTIPHAQSPSDIPVAPDERHPFRYTPALADQIELRWQAHWDQRGTFITLDPGDAGFDATKPKFYCLDMFPYPSGAGLHVGHPEGYTATDIVSRYMRMKGHNVLHPMGWDAFGLPAEQYAIQTGIHPAITTRKAIDNFRRQLKRFGFSYDWSREFGTIDPEYYKWTQWIFLRAYDSWFDPKLGRARPISELTGSRDFIDSHRLAYLGQTTVNWCPALGTVLANDEVIDGKSERGGHPVLRKPLKQWMFRITAYAERLLEDLKLIDWPESTKTMQSEWIGRSEGAEIQFDIAGSQSQSLTVFTTRPDTLFGATYMVVAPEHELVRRAIADPTSHTNVQALRAYVDATRSRSDIDRMADAKDKTGVFTGLTCINPATGKPIPIWTADYVLMGYGTGAIMAVPAHDERDWAFAKAFDLPIVAVYRRDDRHDNAPIDDCFSGDGIAINSTGTDCSLDGLRVAEAKRRTIDWLERSGRGQRKINYRLRDWAFSRQRYWGEPFPIVYDADGRHYPVSERALPVVLPDMADYSPVESDDPQPLLAKATDWINITAGAAGVDPALLHPDTPVRREANTMPGSAGSSWYFLRYCDAKNGERFVDRTAERYWMGNTGGRAGHPASGVDLYIGGPEHAVGHLLYSRFWQKILFDLGEVSGSEPFGRLFHQGMITSIAFQDPHKHLVPVDEVDLLSVNSPDIAWLPDPDNGPADELVALPTPIEVRHLVSPTLRMDGDREQRIEMATALHRGAIRILKAEGSFLYRRGRPFEKLDQAVAKMSKSLKNVVNPDDIIAQFGADTFRIYEMYMGPLAASKPWNTKDAVGIFRFLQRAWRVAVDEQTGALRLADQPSPEVEKHLHRMVAKVEQDIPRLAFNTAIASMIEFVNAATSSGGITRAQLEMFTLALAPFAPHLAEEIWHKLGHAQSLAYEPFPTPNPAMLVDDMVEIPVQIAGKIRARLSIPAADAADKAAVEKAALADPAVRAALVGKTVTKVVVVPGKMVNIVAGG